MIARIIRPAECTNPAWPNIDSSPSLVRFPDGTQPTRAMPPFFPLPCGTILDGPMCWLHCLYGTHNSPPIAEPADDECRRMVASMSGFREVAIDGIREKSQELGTRTPAGRFMSNLAKSYGVD